MADIGAAIIFNARFHALISAVLFGSQATVKERFRECGA